MNSTYYVDTQSNYIIAIHHHDNQLGYSQYIDYEFAELDNYFYVSKETSTLTLTVSTLFNWIITRITTKTLFDITDINYKCLITEQILINNNLQKENSKTIEHNGKPSIAPKYTK